MGVWFIYRLVFDGITRTHSDVMALIRGQNGAVLPPSPPTPPVSPGDSALVVKVLQWVIDQVSSFTVRISRRLSIGLAGHASG
ncbi:hypothetical protein KIPB_016307, partial [Kipferlia bialata]|eukprot:g16307.t1